MRHYGEAVLADENGQMRAAAQAGHLPELSRDGYPRGDPLQLEDDREFAREGGTRLQEKSRRLECC